MPRGDATGPAGQGPMTGRAVGFCAGYPAPGNVNAGGSFCGRGRGRGGGGRRNRYYSAYPAGFNRGPTAGRPISPAMDTASPERELAALKQQAENLKDVLSELQGRMDELEGAAG